ncbi:hypothetical protein KAU08_03750 [bacterium]|nr:hypothetical protein [bacterium]
MSEILNPQGTFSDLSVIITGATRGIGAGIAGKLSLLASNLTLGYIEGDDRASALLGNLKKK